MHGTSEAVGTDWAMSSSGSWGSHRSVWAWIGALSTASSLMSRPHAMPTRTVARSSVSTASPIRRMLQRWMAIGRGRPGRSSRNSACRSRPFSRMRLRSWDGMVSPRVAANPSVISSTVNWPQGPLVDQPGVAAQGQAQHHVGQVDGLAPRARVRLDEGDVDQQHAAVADQQVGRLDVAVGQARRPTACG